MGRRESMLQCYTFSDYTPGTRRFQYGAVTVNAVLDLVWGLDRQREAEGRTLTLGALHPDPSPVGLH